MKNGYQPTEAPKTITPPKARPAYRPKPNLQMTTWHRYPDTTPNFDNEERFLVTVSWPEEVYETRTARLVNGRVIVDGISLLCPCWEMVAWREMPKPYSPHLSSPCV